MSIRSTSWQRTCSDTISWRQDQALNSTIYILRETGPTGFLLKEDGDTKKYKVCCQLTYITGYHAFMGFQVVLVSQFLHTCCFVLVPLPCPVLLCYPCLFPLHVTLSVPMTPTPVLSPFLPLNPLGQSTYQQLLSVVYKIKKKTQIVHLKDQ